MNNLIIRPTVKALKLIGELEFLLGLWGNKTPEITQDFQGLIQLAPNSSLLTTKVDFEISKVKLAELAGSKLRTEKLIFTDYNNRPLFTGVSPFLIEERLSELIKWTRLELELQDIHPIVICAIYHLVFLHIQPFSQNNHALALISSWQILKENSSPAFLGISLAQTFLDRAEQYFSTIKHGEKTCFADWSTINVWIEFFIESLLIAMQKTIEASDKAIKLNLTQEKILHCVKDLGLCKREQITHKTGINIATVKYNLGVLTKLGCLKRTGEGRASSYSFIRKMG